MRTALRDRHGKGPATYEATVGKTGPEGQHLVVTNVTHGGEVVTDHVWFPRTEEWSHSEPGDRVQFSAEVIPYMKGRRRELDYGFARPTMVKKVASPYEAYMEMVRQR